jgi:arginine repressor
MKKIFKYEHFETQEEVRKHIQECEGRHTQQAIYSTFHDGLTQVCFGCKKVRSTL